MTDKVVSQIYEICILTMVLKFDCEIIQSKLPCQCFAVVLK